MSNMTCAIVNEWNENNRQNKQVKCILLEDLYKMPGVHKVYDLQDAIDEFKLSVNNITTYHIYEIPNKLAVMFCSIPHFYGEIKFPKDEVAEMYVEFSDENSLQKFLYMISEKYQETKEEKQRNECEKDVETFRNLHYNKFINVNGPDTIISELNLYITRLAMNPIFNLDCLSVSGDLLWKRIQKYWYALDQEIDYDDVISYDHVHDLFPPLQKFVNCILEVTKDEDINGDCYCGSVLEMADLTFANGLLQIVKDMKNLS